MRCALGTLLMGVVIALPGVVDAQPVATFDALALRLDLGDRADVGLRDGAVLSGRVIALTREAIEIDSSAGRRRMAVADVEFVTTRGDSLTNGLAIGFLSGAVLGGLAGASFSGEFRSGDMVGGALTFGAVGAALGLGLDALNQGTRTLYRADRPRASVAPVVTPRKVGVVAAVRW